MTLLIKVIKLSMMQFRSRGESMNIITQYKGLPKQVYIICITRVVTAMGGFIYSFNSLFMTGVLGLSEVVAGYMMIVFSLVGIAGAFIAGRLADNYGRKKVFVGTMFLAVAALVFGGCFVYSYWAILAMIIMSMCFSGAIPTCSAMVTDNTDPSNRRESFSLMFLCINVGYAIGQAFAGFLFYNYIRWIFWGQALFFGAATLIIVFFFKEVYEPSRVKIESTAGRGDRKEFLMSLKKDKTLLMFLLAIILAFFCYVQINYMMPLHFNKCAGLEESAMWVSRVWVLNGIFCAVWSPVLLRVTERNSQLKNAAIAILLYLVGFGAFAAIGGGSTLWVALIATPIWTAGETLISMGSGVFIAGRAPEAHKAAYQSLFEVASNVGRCIGPVTMGYFLTVFTYQVGWLLVAAVCILAFIIMLTAIQIDKGEKINE